MKYIKLKSKDPYFNLACEEYVFSNLNDGDYLILWKSKNAVVIGKNQNPYAEIDMKAAENFNVDIARRATGGGTVYQDEGNLNYSFIIQPESDFDCMNYVTEALKKLGIKAVLSGRNDIEIEGKKISGTAQRERNGKLMVHGTLLIDSDLDRLNLLLTPDELKLKSKGIESVRSRVCNIREYRAVTENEIVQVLTAGMDEYIVSESETVNIREISEKYASWEFIFGTSPEFEYVKKLQLNCGIVEFGAEIKQGRIVSCKFSGDYLGLKDAEEIADGLAGCRFTKEEIDRVLSHYDIWLYFDNTTKEDLTVI